MRVVISGSSGMVGQALCTALEADGVDILRLVRHRDQAQAGDAALWDPSTGEIDADLLAGADAVVNLNGRSIAGGRWSERVKAELRSSRLDPTNTLARAVAAADPPPPVLVNASAVGFYGSRGEEVLEEGSPPGDSFLARLTRDWEAAALAAASPGTRVVPLRFGMILARGGAVGAMLPAFKLGLGGPIGSGRQWWPWIGIDDVVGVVRHAMATPGLDGALNVVSPHQVRCRQFVKTLGRVLHRPAVLPAPAVAVRLVLGEMADELLLASQRVEPRRLTESGYDFRRAELGDALRAALD